MSDVQITPAADESDDEAVDRNHLKVLERGLAVMRAFNGQRGQLTVAEMARVVELPRATVRRCLLTLTTLGYVASDGRYFRLTPQVLTLAQAYLSSSLLPRVSQSFIEQVSEQLNESCSVSILSGESVIYVARSSRKRPASVHRDVGTHLPAYCTSMGRVLLAHLPPAELDAYFARVALKKFTPATLVDEPQLRVELDKVRNEGVCIIDSELEFNLRAIAVPVYDNAGNIAAAMHVSTEASRVSVEQLRENFLPVLRQAVSHMRLLLSA
ncbi:MAG TPA: IclR family transcriptional regulator C-terminal domain-containing protein [Magnetospirillaceae bacterium]|nr:IclR family transcriptional regulator C-terminal domain-containing protein [Magnetospirillaceae bacterium]